MVRGRAVAVCEAAADVAGHGELVSAGVALAAVRDAAGGGGGCAGGVEGRGWERLGEGACAGWCRM